MSTVPDPEKEPESAQQRPDPAALAVIYQEQFRHIRHLDWSALALVALSVAAFLLVAVLDLIVVAEQNIHTITIHLFVFALTAGSNHYLISNTTAIWLRYAVLTNTERALGLVRAGVVPSILQFFGPVSFADFLWRFINSPRGPLFFLLLIMGWFVLAQFFLEAGKYLGAALALLPGLAMGLLSLYQNYAMARSRLSALHREQELSSALPDQLADRHCDMGEALLKLRPPRLNDAMRQFQLALEADPQHRRAREWLDKMMSWQVKDWGR